MTVPDLAAIMRAALDQSGMTQAELADCLGIHPGEVSRRINNPADLRWSTVTSTLAAMGARVEVMSESSLLPNREWQGVLARWFNQMLGTVAAEYVPQVMNEHAALVAMARGAEHQTSRDDLRSLLVEAYPWLRGQRVDGLADRIKNALDDEAVAGDLGGSMDGHVFAPLTGDIGNCATCGRAIVHHVLMPSWPQAIATDEGEPQGPGRATPADFEGGDGSADPGGISRTPGAATAVLRQAVAYAEANLGSPRAALIRMVDAARITLAAAPLVAVPGHDPDLFPCPAWLDDACPTCAWVDQERIAADLDLDAMEKAIYGGHGVPPTEALTHIAFTRSLLAARPAPAAQDRGVPSAQAPVATATTGSGTPLAAPPAP